MQIFDPVHQFISFTPLEERLLAHPYLDRLRHIYQLGTAFHVYPGATHSRFCHTIGVMHIASEIFSVVAPKAINPARYDYFKQIVRLCALLHDVGHYPFSHTAELFLPKHEEMVQRVLESTTFDPIFADCALLYNEDVGHTKRLMCQIALGERTEIPFLAQIIADPNFGADRIDYLLRDSLYTGLNYGRIDVPQLLRSLQLNGSEQIVIAPSGIPSAEALLLARHWMHERIYQHHRVRALNYHYACVIRDVIEERKALENVEEFMKINDHTIFEALNRFPIHHQAILDPKARVIAKRIPLKELKAIQNLTGENSPLWIDVPSHTDVSGIEGGKIVLEQEEIFWVYTRQSMQGEEC